MDAYLPLKNTTQMAVWKQAVVIHYQYECGQPTAILIGYIDYESNIPHDLGDFLGVCAASAITNSSSH